MVSLPIKYLNSDWKSKWSSSTYQFSSIQPSIAPKPWFFNPVFRKFGKRATSVLIRLRLGHTCSPVRLFKFRLIDSPTCHCGEDEGTIEHIFFHCPLNNKCPPLYSLLSKCVDISLPLNINYLLTIPTIESFIILAKFINANNIKL